MSNTYFQFKKFTIHQDACSMKVTTDACLFGAWVAHELENNDTVKNIADIGAGTGLLSLMLAQKISATIDAIEIQQKDFLQATENIENSLWAERIHLFNADVKNFAFIKKYDAIISNPPFYENDLKSNNQGKNLAHHHSGLELQELLKIIQCNLEFSGFFFILFPFKRKTELLEQLSAHDFYIREILNIQPTDQHEPFRVIIKGSFEDSSDIIEKNMIIKYNDHYSDDFTKLLKPYYLYL